MWVCIDRNAQYETAAAKVTLQLWRDDHTFFDPNQIFVDRFLCCHVLQVAPTQWETSVAQNLHIAVCQVRGHITFRWKRGCEGWAYSPCNGMHCHFEYDIMSFSHFYWVLSIERCFSVSWTIGILLNNMFYNPLSAQHVFLTASNSFQTKIKYGSTLLRPKLWLISASVEKWHNAINLYVPLDTLGGKKNQK